MFEPQAIASDSLANPHAIAKLFGSERPMTKDAMLNQLRGLAQLEVDALQLVGAAMQHAKDPTLRRRFEEFRDVHREHVRVLDAVIAKLDGRPVAIRPDAKGRVLERIASVGAMIGDEGLLVALVGGEELVHKRYEALLDEHPWSADVKPLLDDQFAASARQLAFCRAALDSRLERMPLGAHV